MIARWLAVAILLAAPGALAQTSTGIAADRFVPAVGPLSLFSVEGAPVTEAGALRWALSLGWVQDPITLRNDFTGALVTRPVSGQLSADLSMELGLWKRRLALSMGLPVVLSQSGDRLAGVDADTKPLASPAGGDFRARLKLALVGDPERAGLHVGVGLELTLPFGGERDFAATSTATVAPRLYGDARIGPVVLMANLGVRFAPDRTLFRTTFGDELLWSAGAGWAAFLTRRGFWGGLLAEFAGAVGSGSGTRPAEFRSGVRAGYRSLSLDLGAGLGLDTDATAPAWRIFAVVRQALRFD
jgi:hypothetical protein